MSRIQSIEPYSMTKADPPDVEITNPDHIKILEAALADAYKTELQATETWGLEVVKTLFLLNSVGLTGVFALVATDHVMRPDLPFLQFSLGIVLAVISMTLGRYVHLTAQEGWWKSLEQFRIEAKLSLLKLSNLKIVNILQIFCVLCAYASGLLCIWAGVRLYLLF
ncbi:hypothetical protein [Pollutimonas sp. M17]|uniref:hypothetical protein n=1 Tax=Pollutimonas sp. M17 TaxID=2962065 RepID=UPI0021F43221|nr:hypothetical protein [Pollutimonas sp. M17]UYO92425.1 hypothetical protein OEG81_10890 [Pollutimonas sp. M17]